MLNNTAHLLPAARDGGAGRWGSPGTCTEGHGAARTCAGEARAAAPALSGSCFQTAPLARLAHPARTPHWLGLGPWASGQETGSAAFHGENAAAGDSGRGFQAGLSPALGCGPHRFM